MREDEHIRPAWWPTAVSVGSSVLSAILATTLCLTVSARNAERGREARRELQEQNARIKNSVCGIVVALDNNYRENPPPSQLGQDNAQDLRELRVVLGCPPP